MVVRLLILLLDPPTTTALVGLLGAVLHRAAVAERE
jgi:hypothetical protein